MNEQTCPWAIQDADGKTIGIGVPLINKAIYFADIPEGDKYMDWYKAKAYAKSISRKIPTRNEMYIIAYYKGAINAIAAAVGHPDFLNGLTWSSTESSTNFAWYALFGAGTISYTYKYFTLGVVRPVAAFKYIP